MDLTGLKHRKLSKSRYEKQLPGLQQELARLQLGLYKSDQRAIIVVEGADAAGKGGFVRRLIWQMDPRGYTVYPIGAPTEEELSKHYLQRFWKRVPENGQLVVFDRSWYGRVLVERVEGLTAEAEWQRAYEELNNFEKLLQDDGDILIKLFFVITKEEQTRRLKARFENPDKRWKLTEADLTSRSYWDDYQAAYRDMLEQTSTDRAPWQVIAGDDKRHARIAAMSYVRDRLDEVVDLSAIEMMPRDLETEIRRRLYNSLEK